MYKNILTGCLVSLLLAKAQGQRLPLSAPYLQLVGYSSQPPDAFSAHQNTAALARLQHFSAGLYGEHRFLLAELGWYQLALALPSEAGTFGFTGTWFGQTGFNESSASLYYARTLGMLDIGLRFNYQSLKMGSYGHAFAFTVEGGIQFPVVDKLRAGMHLYNPTRSGFLHHNQKLPLMVTAGLGYDASSQLYLGAAVVKPDEGAAAFEAVVQYLFAGKLLARAGLVTGTGTFYFGGGFLLGNLRIDLSASLHPYLGLSPGTLILYKPEK